MSSGVAGPVVQEQAAAAATWPDPTPVKLLRRLDVPALIGLLLCSVASLALVRAFSGQPYEDAAMLLRYSQNLADGHGLVYNVGSHPVDGATDFLFTVLVAALNVVGFSVLTAARILDVIGLVGTIAVVYVSGRRWTAAPWWVCSAAALLIALGPAAFYTRAGFGASFFGFTVALSAVAAHRLARSPSTRAAIIFALLALTMGLTRPEGALLAAFLAAAVAVTTATARRPLLTGSAVFIGLGLVYFGGRWIYFGQPLPNPYYTKGAGGLYVSGLRSSIKSILGWLAPILVLYLLPLRDRSQWRTVLFAVMPAGLFALVWLLLSDETNHQGRFQYPVLVLAAVELPYVWAATKKAWPITRDGRRLAATIGMAAILGCVVHLAIANNDATVNTANGNSAIGTVLAGFPHRTLATSEAGLVPLRSSWRTIDTWGLNDQHIAHHGLDAAYLEANRPAVIMLHCYPGGDIDGLRMDPLLGGQRWHDMSATVIRYATQHGYRLAAAFGTGKFGQGFEEWRVWIDSSQPDASQLAAAIRGIHYEINSTSLDQLVK